VRRHVKGARPDIEEALDAVEAHQGENGEPIWLLHQLNNTAKHRLLLTVGAGFRGYNAAPSINSVLARAMPNHPPIADVVVGTTTWQCPLEAGTVLHTTASDEEFHQNMYFIFEIALAEPGVRPHESILETLLNLSNFVQNVVDKLGGLL
jgi:hypothetical protein